jgi:GntR family transcriptional regulator/MocR family aminotransferase
MLTYNLRLDPSLPLYERLCRQIRADIWSGRLAPGTHLPSRRELAQHLGISVATVEAAYAQLVDEGCLQVFPRRGYFVADALLTAAPAPEPTAPTETPTPEIHYRVDFTANHLQAEQFPFSIWARLTRAEITRRGAQLLQPVPHNGVPELRQAIAAHLRQFRGLNADPDCIVVGAGTEYLYHMLIQFLGRERCYAVEDPGYGKIAQIYQMNGAQFCYVGMDSQGPDMAELEQSGASVMHLSPSHHFPTGIVTSLPRRQALLRWSQAAPDRVILEDDYDSEFRFTGRPIPPLQSLDSGGRTIYLNTFSKTIAPSFRISYLVLPSQMVGAYQERMAFYATTVPALEQYVLASFLQGGYFARHLGRMKRFYRARRNEILRAIQASPLANRAEIREADAGLHLLLELHTTRPDTELQRDAAALGIRLQFLSTYCHRPAPENDHCILLNYSGVNPAQLPEALAQLATLC